MARPQYFNISINTPTRGERLGVPFVHWISLGPGRDKEGIRITSPRALTDKILSGECGPWIIASKWIPASVETYVSINYR